MDINDWIIDMVEDSFAEAVEVNNSWTCDICEGDLDELLDDIRNGLERRIEEDRLSNLLPFDVYHKFVDDIVLSRMPIGYSGMPITPRVPDPVKVWFNPPYTTVQFSDGDKVTVEQDDFEDNKFNEYAGFCCAVTKKLFGGATGAFKQFEAAKKKAVEDSPKFKKAKARRFEKERKAMIREETHRRREFQIHMEMERLKTEQEAKKRLEADK